MTDEMNIQQRPSALPYAGIGGALGAVGGYGLSKIDAVKKYVSEPAKYSSYEDLIKEKDDTFTKALNEAEGEEKELMEKAKTAREAGTKAAEKWENDKKAFLEKNKSGEAPTLPSNHEAQQAYDAKRKELIEKEAERLENAQPKGGREVPQSRILKGKAEKIYRATTPAEAKAAEAELDKVIDSLVEKYQYKGTKEEIKVAKEAMKKELKAHTQEMVAMMDINRIAPSQPKIVQNYVSKKAELAKLEAGITNSIESLSKTTGIDMKGYVNGDKIDSMFDNRLRSITNREKNMIDTLKVLKHEYTNASKPDKLNFWERLNVFLTGEIPEGIGEDPKTKLIKKLDSKQKAQLEKLLKNGELSEQLFDDAIKTHETKINDIKKAVDTIFENQEKINGKKGLKKSIAKDLAKIRTTYKDAGAYIDKEGILRKADGTAIIEKTPIKSPSGIKLPKGVTVPEGGVKLKRTVKTMTKEEFAEQATKNIDANAGELLKAEQDAINKAREALPKNPEKSVEQLTKEFIEKNGTKEEAIKKAQDGLKDDLKKLFEGKTKAGKLALLALGTAALGSLVGLAFRPSAKEEA